MSDLVRRSELLEPYEAIERALDDLARDDHARELRAETRSTGEAPRDITGQR